MSESDDHADAVEPDPVRSTAPQAPPALDDEENAVDEYLDQSQPAVMPVAGMGAGTVPRAPRDGENK